MPATENAVFARGESLRAWNWAQNFESVVIKPVDGHQGQDVFIGLSTREEFSDAYEAVAARESGRVLVEEFCHGVEHRCLLVNGKLFAATRRRAASVLGDGVSSIGALVDDKNKSRGPIHRRVEVDEEAHSLLADEGLRLDSVVAEGERVYLRRASNIHRGGDAIDATDDLTAEEIAAVEKIASTLRGAKLIGADVLLPRDGQGSVPRVIELNTEPMISMHHFPWEGTPRDAAGAVLDVMFPATSGR